MRPRIVIDTSVFIAALRSQKGASYKLLMAMGKGHFDTCISVPLVLEYEAVAKRMKGKLGLTAADIDDIIDYICSVSRHIKIFYLWRPTLKDPADEMLLELAVTSNSNYIVTFNIKDFAGTERFKVKAIEPGDFVKIIGGIK